jgi:uncharacterized protein YecE (DUF72 family)
MRIKLGMCGFTIGAAQYYRQFPVVEVQQTFYDPPTDERLAKWRAQAPPAFEFTMKAWQVITHLGTSRTYRRLKSPFTERQRSEAGAFRPTRTVVNAWHRTVECAAILRVTAILFQCPASFRATDENVANMQAFFTSIDRPDGVRLVWEPRGPWPDDLVSSLCHELGLIHAVDPFVRPSLTPELLYWRLHGNGSHWARYTDEELHQIDRWLNDASGAEAYLLFNNVPRIHDVRRYRELGLAGTPQRILQNE